MEQGYLKDGWIIWFVARDWIAVMSPSCSDELWRDVTEGRTAAIAACSCLLGVCRDPVTGEDTAGINWKIRNSNQIRGGSERSNSGTENLWHHHPGEIQRARGKDPEQIDLLQTRGWTGDQITALHLQTVCIPHPGSCHTVLMERTHYSSGSHCPGILY